MAKKSAKKTKKVKGKCNRRKINTKISETWIQRIITIARNNIIFVFEWINGQFYEDHVEEDTYEEERDSTEQEEENHQEEEDTYEEDRDSTEQEEEEDHEEEDTDEEDREVAEDHEEENTVEEDSDRDEAADLLEENGDEAEEEERDEEDEQAHHLASAQPVAHQPYDWKLALQDPNLPTHQLYSGSLLTLPYPYVTVVLQWGRCLRQREKILTDDDQKRTTPHGSWLENFPELEIHHPLFDHKLAGHEEDLKERIRKDWVNVLYEGDNIAFCAHEWNEHARKCSLMTQEEYLKFTLDSYDALKKDVHICLEASCGEALDENGTRLLNLEDFRTRLSKKNLFPSIHFKYGKFNIYKKGSYQQLFELRFYMVPGCPTVTFTRLKDDSDGIN